MTFSNGQKLVQTSQYQRKVEKQRSTCHVREIFNPDERHHASKEGAGFPLILYVVWKGGL